MTFEISSTGSRWSSDKGESLAQLDIIYYSNRSGNTARFVKKLGRDNSFTVQDKPEADKPYVLFTPTYGSGEEDYAVPLAVRRFLEDESNAEKMVAVLGFGNTNFGADYCKAARVIRQEFGTPILGTIELFGFPEQLDDIREKMRKMDERL
jgi:protein involved in ribonucleotide reduction